MKRQAVLCVALSLVLLFGLCGCGQQETTQQAPAQEAAQQTPTTDPELEIKEYHLVAGETLDVSDQVFAQPVVVYIDAASTSESQSIIQFINCTFAKGLTMIGDRSGWVRLLDGCNFGNDSFITVKEATEGSMKTGVLEDDFLKLYIDTLQPNIKVESTALLNTISTHDVTINGTMYKLSDFPDCNTFCAAYYYENDELTVYTEGWVEEE